MKKVKKVIKPFAGLGTRILTDTKKVPKEMPPIDDKPTIQYIVVETVAYGIEYKIIVIYKGKRNFHNYIRPADKFILNGFGTSYNNLSKVLNSKYILARKKKYRNLPQLNESLLVYTRENSVNRVRTKL